MELPLRSSSARFRTSALPSRRSRIVASIFTSKHALLNQRLKNAHRLRSVCDNTGHRTHRTVRYCRPSASEQASERRSCFIGRCPYLDLSTKYSVGVLASWFLYTLLNDSYDYMVSFNNTVYGILSSSCATPLYFPNQLSIVGRNRVSRPNGGANG
jgi:hypothetical protein